MAKVKTPRWGWALTGSGHFFKECLANGLILMGYTPRVRVHPPLVLSAAEATRALAIIGGALERLESC